jgi:DNA-directed RNA polymerase specialized sigma24 family protein
MSEIISRRPQTPIDDPTLLHAATSKRTYGCTNRSKLPTPIDPFDALLDWLDTDRDIAALKYETIRAGLIRIFVSKGFSDAEDMADETIRRVSKRLPDIRDSYLGEPKNYFHGVARNIIREKYRLREIATDVSPVASIQITNRSDEYECLTRCLKFMDPTKRELILDYHVYEGHDKIEQHEIMAQELRISKGTLRLRTHHIRTKLEECVLKCIENLRHETKAAAESIVTSGAKTRSVKHVRGRRTKA